MSDDRRPPGTSVLLIFLAGAAAGAAVALLTAPKSGRQLRESIREWARDQKVSAASSRAVRAARRAFDEIVGDDASEG